MNNNKKGFTIVELVIVIAVIAVLAGVLIPTFSTVIENANRSAALQDASIAIQMAGIEESAELHGKYYIVTEKYLFVYDAEGSGISDGKPKSYKDQKTTRDAVIDDCTGKKPEGQSVVYYAKSEEAAAAILGESRYTAGTTVVVTNVDISDDLIVIGFKAE